MNLDTSPLEALKRKATLTELALIEKIERTLAGEIRATAVTAAKEARGQIYGAADEFMRENAGNAGGDVVRRLVGHLETVVKELAAPQ